MKKVLTMTLNPCIDRTIYFKTFKQGATNYVDNLMEEAAGKGINTAIGLAHIGVEVKALGFAYTDNCKCLYEKLESERIAYAFVELPGRMRVNQKLFDLSTREMTECNERGQVVLETDVDRILTLLEEELNDASILVLSGSVPPGVDKDIYARMIHMAKANGVLTVLDASGELLMEGCREMPYLIKPNREEFAAAFLDDTWKAERANGENTDEISGIALEQKLAKRAEELTKTGIAYVCISLGAEGMMLADKNGVQHYPAKLADVKSLQGAGDAMVAGLCKAIYEKEEKNMAEYALAMAASTISLPGTRMGTLE